MFATSSSTRFSFLGAILMVFGSAIPSIADEGMFPISEIHRLDLADKGLQLTPKEIFSSDKVCLVDGIVRVNGCTGSFVSAQGLIITNHHCAYAAIQQASSPQHDYLRNGFVAANLGEEIPAKGYVVKVTQSFEDVSEKMLAAVDDQMDFTERTKALERRQKELENAAEEANPGMRAEIAEMFTGKSYVLFLYTYLKDVRLVFAPPESVGKFGGDVDNWEWPRHTGDFSFMRAYVAPDGTSADYSKDNVPYQPKRFIQIAPAGVQESEFVMLLGYPGRTARHRTARYLQFLQHDALPRSVELNRAIMEIMDEEGASDRGIALKNLSRYQSLANVEKRSRGQLKGLANTSILAQRFEEEQRLEEFIAADPSRHSRFRNLISGIAEVYDQQSSQYTFEANLAAFRSQVLAYSIAATIYEAVREREKPDLEREPAYMDRNFDQTINRALIDQQNFNEPTDRRVFALMWERLRSTSDLLGEPVLDQLYWQTKIQEAEFIQRALKMSVKELDQLEDPFIQLAAKLYPEHVRLRDLNKTREGELNKLYGHLLTVKQEFQQTQFIPDANGTLRLTYGTVRGYSPADAVLMRPFTTLSGMIAKATGADPFIVPDEVRNAWQQKKFGSYAVPQLNEVPVAILYDTDTTGGNSGSPVINGRGELVGVNFDRTFEATINDFAWNTNYSRSIGVDIRYALWITGVVYNANHLLHEMNVSKVK
jgi:hypothetical protein